MARAAAAVAVDRLVSSREQLRLALLDAGPPAQGGAWCASPASAADAGPRLPAWLDRLASLPVAKLLVEALGAWWSRHPLRLAAQLATDAAQVLVQPLAQRHPIGLVLGSALAGSLLAWSRPWRWACRPALTPALLAGLLPQLISQMVRQAPLGTWTTLLSLPTRGPARDDGHEAGRGRQSQ